MEMNVIKLNILITIWRGRLGKYHMLFALFCVFIIAPAGVFAGTAPQNWDKFEKKIRDNAIQKPRAKAFVKAMRPLLDSYYYAAACDTTPSVFVFPVEGYGPDSIGGKKGSGYIASRYDFFEGNKHSGHPAHDIFIRDRNHDLKDDRTGKPVRVLSASDGVVVSVNTGWEPGSEIRGGNTVWVYDPGVKGLYYYAHMDKISVKTGDIVNPGQELGTVGRTGKSAFPRRSATHLHFMFLSYGKDGTMKPENIYKSLVKRIPPAARE